MQEEPSGAAIMALFRWGNDPNLGLQWCHKSWCDLRDKGQGGEIPYVHLSVQIKKRLIGSFFCMAELERTLAAKCKVEDSILQFDLERSKIELLE